MMSNVFVSGKALAAGLLETPAASVWPLRTNREISASINLRGRGKMTPWILEEKRLRVL